LSPFFSQDPVFSRYRFLIKEYQEMALSPGTVIPVFLVSVDKGRQDQKGKKISSFFVLLNNIS